MSFVTSLVLAGILGAAVTPAAPRPLPSTSAACTSTDAAAIHAVRAVAEGIVAADNRRDLAAVLDFYDADATLLPPGEEPVVGRAAIRPRYQQLFRDFDPAIVGRIDDACTDGRLAVVRGRNLGHMTSRTGGPARELSDVYIMVLRHGGDGRWRITELIWHSSRRP